MIGRFYSATGSIQRLTRKNVPPEAGQHNRDAQQNLAMKKSCRAWIQKDQITLIFWSTLDLCALLMGIIIPLM
jgi:hypothetical protein